MTANASFEELYQFAACGQLSTDADGVILVVNETFLRWSGRSRDQVVGTLFRDLLSRGSQLFYETRYHPVLRLGGEIREVALELSRGDLPGLPILVNAIVVGESTRIAVFDSTQRQDYERDLLAARRAAEMSESRVRVLQNASLAFFSATTEQSLGEALLRIARDALVAADGAVVMLDETGAPRVVAGSPHSLELLGLWSDPLDQVEPPAEWVTTIGNLRVAESRSAAGAGMLRSLRMEAFTSTPLIGSTHLLGSLVLLFGREREFDQRSLSLHLALARQASLALERLRLQAQLKEMALHDQLTGLANRNLLRERLSDALARAHRTEQPMSIIFLDLDGFKEINDGFGHRVGDAVLQTIASRVSSVVRETDIVGRFGGDEFLIVCEAADAVATTLIAERVAAVIAERITELPTERCLTASVGIATVLSGSPQPSMDALVRAADAAMYSSKTAGTGRITTVTL